MHKFASDHLTTFHCFKSLAWSSSRFALFNTNDFGFDAQSPKYTIQKKLSLRPPYWLISCLTTSRYLKHTAILLLMIRHTSSVWRIGCRPSSLSVRTSTSSFEVQLVVLYSPSPNIIVVNTYQPSSGFVVCKHT